MWTNVLSESGTQYDLKKNLFKVYNMHLLGGMQYGYLYIEPNKHKCTDRHTQLGQRANFHNNTMHFCINMNVLPKM